MMTKKVFAIVTVLSLLFVMMGCTRLESIRRESIPASSITTPDFESAVSLAEFVDAYVKGELR